MNAPESPTALTVINREVATRNREEGLAAQLHDPSKQAILRNTLTTDLTKSEFDLFIEVCAATGLNPFMRQIYAIKRGTNDNAKMTIQTGIDGYRLLAQRTGQFDGQDGPYWCGEDGEWKDVWLSGEPPVAAKVVVYRKDTSRGFTGIARFDEYAQYTQEWVQGKKTGRQILNSMWGKMPAGQIAKCASSLALRMAFPAEMSGIYTDEEMGQADNLTGSAYVARHHPEAFLPGPTGDMSSEAYDAAERAGEEEEEAEIVWAWMDAYDTARKDAGGMKHGPIAQFLGVPVAELWPAIDAWLGMKDVPPKALVSAVADWLAAGKPKAPPAPVTAPETFDEGDWTDPSTEPALFDMAPEPQRAAPGRHG